MKSFKQYIIENPLLMAYDNDDGPSKDAPFLGKPLTSLVHRGGQVPRLLKPKSKGKIGDYTFHHASVQDRPIFGDPTTTHHMFIAKDGKVVGHFSGQRFRVEKPEKGKPIEHIGIDIAAIDPAHRGKGLYASGLAHFVKKSGHVLYSDIAQTPGSAKSWKKIAQTADENQIDFRVHPLLGKPHMVGNGIPVSGELNPGYWMGGPIPGGRIEADQIRFSIRGKK